MCLMKSPKNFEKIASLKIWWLVSFWSVKIHFGGKYAWFAIEILIHGGKSFLLDVFWSQKVIKNHLDTTQSMFSKDNNYKGAILVKIKYVISENASFQKCVFNFLQNTKTSLIAVKLNSFVRFLEETSAWKNHFDFVWPLTTLLRMNFFFLA